MLYVQERDLTVKAKVNHIASDCLLCPSAAYLSRQMILQLEFIAAAQSVSLRSTVASFGFES